MVMYRRASVLITPLSFRVPRSGGVSPAASRRGCRYGRKGEAAHGIHLKVMASTSSSETPPDIPAIAVLENGFVDYYELMQVDDDATAGEIKAAYRSLAKVCHPDMLGEAGHNLCILLNEAYDVLSDPNLRAAYNQELQQAILDETDGFTGKPLSKWAVGTSMGKNEDPGETRAVFVDENTCIGCKMCMWCAPATFRMEPDYGRSRAYGQWLDTEEDLTAAKESCPVSCIHWVEKEDLPALEYVMQNQDVKVDVGMMMSGQGGGVVDPFEAAAKMMRERQAREAQAQARRAKSKQCGAQEEARREAAEEIRRQQGFGGWFRDAVQKAADGAVGSSGEEREDEQQNVGARRRSRHWNEEEALENGATIPPERALVGNSVDDEARE